MYPLLGWAEAIVLLLFFHGCPTRLAHNGYFRYPITFKVIFSYKLYISLYRCKNKVVVVVAVAKAVVRAGTGAVVGALAVAMVVVVVAAVVVVVVVVVVVAVAVVVVVNT